MAPQVLEYPRIDEVLYRQTLPSGLQLAVIPRPGYRKTFATFATHYGSIDNRFRLPQSGEEISVPEGIAHFLEHKMFEKADGGDVFEDFARLGASSNAYTDYTSTTFLFSTTTNLSENLEVLVDFVQRPFFTEENVEKEKGIIEQEIRMYLDMPGDRLQSNLMRALYVRHPIRIDIAGTVESIRTITPETLYQCYRTFYHPSNMALLVVGDVDPEAVMAQVAENQAKKSFGEQAPIVRIFPEEPAHVAEAEARQTMAVANPLFVMGYKDARVGLTGEALLRQEIVAGLFWTVLLGKSAPLYTELYRDGLINDRFHARYTAGLTFAWSALGGETPDPERLQARLIEAIPQAPLIAEDLDRAKKRDMGSYLGLFQNLEELAYVYNNFHFRDIDLFRYLDVLATIRVEDLEAFRRETVTDTARSVSVILPGG